MKIQPRLLVLAGAAALAISFALPSTSTAFSLIGGQLGISTTSNGYQRDFRVWNNAIDAAANNNVTPDPTHPGALGAALAVWKAGQAWNSNNTLAARNFDFDWQGGVATSGGNNSNTVFWGDPGCGGGTLAFTQTPISDGWVIQMCESGLNWADGPGNPGGGQFDIQGVAAHELGHALGLGHSSVNCSGACTNYTTMCPAVCGSAVEQRTIATDDQSGLAAIYGAIAGNKPTITAVSGTFQLGSVLTITGTNFPNPGTVSVKFSANTSQNTGAIPGLVTNVATTSTTSLNVTIPAAAIDGNVLVWNIAASPRVLSNPFPIDVGGAAPPPPPILFSVSPLTVQAFQGGVVTLTGDNFTGATAVHWGSTNITNGITVLDDQTLTIDDPVASQLGLIQVTVTTAGGTSNFVFANVGLTDPLTLVGDATVANGGTANWSWGGDANQPQFLVVNFTGLTFTYLGKQMLNFQIFQPFGATTPVGLGGLAAPISGAPVGLPIFMQILTATSEADLDLSNITTTTVQ